MSRFDPARDAQSLYQFWLGLIPQFFNQFGAVLPGAADSGTLAGGSGAPADSFAPLMNGLAFPADQIAHAAAITRQSLQSLGNAFAPMLEGGDLLGGWAKTIEGFTANLAATAAIPQAQIATAFDRTYGALGDALGMTPARELHDAWRDVLAAGIAQQQARARYALIVQGAFAEGLQRLTRRLADRAQAGERIDSGLALLRMWAVSTEEVVHETLQSERGLAATTALARSSLAYRKRIQQVAAVLADLLDMATRRDLDDAYREIQQLKREVRALQQARAPERARATNPTAKRTSKQTSRQTSKRTSKRISKEGAA